MEDKIAAIESQLPDLGPPSSNYIHAVRTGNLLFLTGKAVLVKGRVGEDYTTEQAYAHARDIGMILLAAIKRATGSLHKVRQIVKVNGMVNATHDFAEHSEVINGCSDLFIEVFGDRGRHARSCFGVASIPMNLIIEIEAIVEVEDE